MEIPSEAIGIGVTVGLAGAGMIGAVLRWSLGRNIEQLDEKMDEIRSSVADMGKSLSELRAESVTTDECTTCRRECEARMIVYQQDILSWLRRQDDKSDKLLMMIANMHNGVGGIK